MFHNPGHEVKEEALGWGMAARKHEREPILKHCWGRRDGWCAQGMFALFFAFPGAFTSGLVNVLGLEL